MKIEINIDNDKKEKYQSWETTIKDIGASHTMTNYNYNLTGYGEDKKESIESFKAGINEIKEVLNLIEIKLDNVNDFEKDELLSIDYYKEINEPTKIRQFQFGGNIFSIIQIDYDGTYCLINKNDKKSQFVTKEYIKTKFNIIL